jgi:hypothetical protein
MSWQVKRYSALMKSFHREADDKIIGALSTYAEKKSYQLLQRPAASTGARQPYAERRGTTPQQYNRDDTADSRNEDRRRSMRDVAR